MLAVILTTLAPSAGTSALAETAPPNFVFILADDMRRDDLRYMPKTTTLLGEQGMTFDGAFVTNALCCPSRATIMRGQYAHNTGVWMNGNVESPYAGWEAYLANGHEQDNIATRLHDNGYRTGLIGKYITGYKGTDHVPPGWDEWFGTWGPYFGYSANINGEIHRFGSEEHHYHTDVLKRRAGRFIAASVAAESPFFAFVAAKAAHAPFTPAPRHLDRFNGLQVPPSPSLNEKDVSDKPPWIQALTPLSQSAKKKLNARYEARMETLQALDDLVAGLVRRLERLGALEQTYLVFTSDNGWHQGEHRIRAGKARPYEESIAVPLLVRGPGITPGTTTSALVVNTDYLPTVLDLADLDAPDYVDGRSLRPLFATPDPDAWRTAILIEGLQVPEGRGTPALAGIRTERRKYITYEGGFAELYRLPRDPYELVNTYDPTAPPLVLGGRLENLRDCAGEACRVAENGP